MSVKTYVTVVEIEYSTDRCPLTKLRDVLQRLEFLEHYRIVKPPREIQ